MPALTTCDGAVRRALWRPGARPARPLDASEGVMVGAVSNPLAAGSFWTVPTYSSPDGMGGAAREAERHSGLCSATHRERCVMPNHRLLAWIEPKDDHYTAALVTAAAQRLPATRDCGSVEEARAWVESEAVALHVPVIWTGHPTARSRAGGERARFRLICPVGGAQGASGRPVRKIMLVSGQRFPKALLLPHVQSHEIGSSSGAVPSLLALRFLAEQARPTWSARRASPAFA